MNIGSQQHPPAPDSLCERMDRWIKRLVAWLDRRSGRDEPRR